MRGRQSQVKQTIVVGVAWALALGMAATSADATTITIRPAYYAGVFEDDTSSREPMQMVDFGAWIPFPAGNSGTPMGAETYGRGDSAILGLLAAPVVASLRQQTGAYSAVNVNGSTHILGIYGTDQAWSYGWSASGLNTAGLPQLASSWRKAESYVWQVSGGNAGDLPELAPAGNRAGSSAWHVSNVNAGDLPELGPSGGTPGPGPKSDPVSVPDGGATLVMLGASLVGLEALRRRFRA